MKIKILNDIRYGQHERNFLDIAFPENAKGDIGLVLMIHGGGWIAGDKSTYAEEIKNYAKCGVVSASINYRYISDSSDCFDILDDITAALSKIKELGTENGMNIKKALFTGLSAGGHLSLQYAYSRKNSSPIEPAAVAALSGPADMASDEAVYKFTHGNEMGDASFVFGLISMLCGTAVNENNCRFDEIREKAEAVSPVYYVDRNTVPTIIAHAVKDAIVPLCNAQILEKALAENDIEHECVYYPTATHVLCDDPECIEKTQKLINEYIARYLPIFRENEGEQNE